MRHTRCCRTRRRGNSTTWSSSKTPIKEALSSSKVIKLDLMRNIGIIRRDRAGSKTILGDNTGTWIRCNAKFWTNWGSNKRSSCVSTSSSANKDTLTAWTTVLIHLRKLRATMKPWNTVNTTKMRGLLAGEHRKNSRNNSTIINILIDLKTLFWEL